MRSTLQILSLLLLIFIDVRVGARQSEVVESPENCLQKSSDCLLKVNSKHWGYETEDLRLWLERGSAVLRINANHWRVLGGSIWLQCKAKIRVDTILGEVNCHEASELIVEKNQSSVSVKTIRGVALVQAKKSSEWLKVPEAYETELRWPMASGHVEVSFPRAFHWDTTLAKMGLLNQGSKKQFIDQVHELRPLWREASLVSGEIAQYQAEREIANHIEEVERMKQLRQKSESENKKLRELFRQKNYLD